MVLDLSNGCQISLRVYVHGAVEILRIVSIVLNEIYQCIEGHLVCRFKVNIGQGDINYRRV